MQRPNSPNNREYGAVPSPINNPVYARTSSPTKNGYAEIDTKFTEPLDGKGLTRNSRLLQQTGEYDRLTGSTEHLLQGNIYASDSYESDRDVKFDEKGESFPDVHNQENPYEQLPGVTSNVYEAIPDQGNTYNTYDTIPALQNMHFGNKD